MLNYVLILFCCSQLPQNDTNILLAKPLEKQAISQPKAPKKATFFESIFGKIIRPKYNTTVSSNIHISKKKLVKIKYKKYTMAEGEGLWQVAEKKNIALKDVPAWIELIAKKNKLYMKDSHDNYVLSTGDIIWIPIIKF